MKKLLLFILFHIGVVFTLFSQSFIDTVSAHTYVPYGFVKLDSIIKTDILYKFHSDSTSDRYYVSSHDRIFTDAGIKDGNQFQKIKHLGKLQEYRGWGYYVQLSSGWNAYLCLNKSEIESSKVLFFFSTKKEVFERIIAR